MYRPRPSDIPWAGNAGEPLAVALRRDLVFVAQPFFFALATVIARFDAVPSAPGALLRPVLVVLVATAIVLAIALLLTRNPLLAAVLSSAFVMISLRELALGGVLAAVALWWLLLRILQRRDGHGENVPTSFRTVSRGAGVVGIALLIASAALAAIGQVSGHPTIAPGDTAIEVDGEGGPNVYLILLDGYPRGDVLTETFTYDNGPFTDALEDRGFVVSAGARSNYRKTWATLASMFNGRYLDELVGDQPVPDDPATQMRWAQSLINEGRLLDVFRDRGYSIVTVPSAFTSAALLTSDATIDHGYVNELEANLIGRSPWASVFRREADAMIGSAHRWATLDALDVAADIAENESEQPRLAFIHVLSPHTPFVLGDDLNDPPHLAPCFPAACSVWDATMAEIEIDFREYRARLIEQIGALNDVILDTLDRIIDADPDGIVVLMSDHGSRYALSDRQEHFKSFLAARSPGRDPLFAADESPVNLLRRIISAEFDADLEPLDYEAWWSDPGILDLTRLEIE
jgi:hypothetical protein